MAAPTSTRERLFTGIAVVVILGIAFWLFLGRSPSGGPKRVEVGLGQSVETDAGTVTVYSLGDVPPEIEHAPAATAGNEVQAIRFRSCRNEPDGRVVDVALFSVGFNGGRAEATATGSALVDSSGSCVGGLAFVQAPLGASADSVEYAADPVGVWVFPLE